MNANDRHGPPEEIFAGLVPPAPPNEMRGRVLGAAHSAWGEEPGSDLWTRIWYHRGLRAAWAGAIVLLVVGHFFVASGNSSLVAFTEDSRPDLQMAEFLRPVRIVASATPAIGRFSPDVTEITTLSMGGSDS